MHTFEWPRKGSPEDCPEKKVFILSDGDTKGAEAIITKPDGSEIRLEADALIAFVAKYVMYQRVGDLEDASDDEILGIHRRRISSSDKRTVVEEGSGLLCGFPWGNS